MLADRKIPFSESKEEEWEILRQKTEGGIELMLEDSQRWFLATAEDDGIRITSAEKNVRPLTVREPPLIRFDEFQRVAEVYNDSFFGGIGDLSARLETHNSSPNMRYLFMLIYYLI